MNEHAYEPVDFGMWNVLKPYVKSEKLKKVVLLHIFGGNGDNAIFVTSDDEVYAAGSSLSCYLKISYAIGPRAIIHLTAFSHKLIKCFSTGNSFTIGLTGDGRLLSCGSNGCGQLGIGDLEERSGIWSVIIPNEVTIVSIQCCSDFSLALTSCSKVYEWGFRDITRGESGKLSTPKIIDLLSKGAIIYGIACCGYTYAALSARANVWKWETSKRLEIVAGEVSTMGLYTGGCVYIIHGNLYQNEKFMAEADDFVAHGDYLCFKKGDDFFKKKYNELPKKVDVPNFQSAFANLWCPQFVRMSPNAKALNTKKKIISDNNFYEMFYNNKDLSDLTIKLSNGHIYLQKLNLMGLCDHFKQVLTGPWAASNSTEMDMSSYNPVAYETFLKYVYSGIFYCDTLTGSDLIDLYNIAESYFENDLKENVFEVFKQSLTIENVCQLYSLADKQMQLVNECLKFARNNILVICATDGFNQMEAECSKTFMINCATRNLLI